MQFTSCRGKFIPCHQILNFAVGGRVCLPLRGVWFIPELPERDLSLPPGSHCLGSLQHVPGGAASRTHNSEESSWYLLADTHGVAGLYRATRLSTGRSPPHMASCTSFGGGTGTTSEGEELVSAAPGHVLSGAVSLCYLPICFLRVLYLRTMGFYS